MGSGFMHGGVGGMRFGPYVRQLVEREHGLYGAGQHGNVKHGGHRQPKQHGDR